MCRKTTYFVKVLRKNKILLDLSLHLGNWLQKEWFESYILQTKHHRRKFLRIWVYLCVVKIWQLKFSGWAFLNTPVIQILPTGQWGCSPWSAPKNLPFFGRETEISFGQLSCLKRRDQEKGVRRNWTQRC